MKLFFIFYHSYSISIIIDSTFLFGAYIARYFTGKKVFVMNDLLIILIISTLYFLLNFTIYLIIIKNNKNRRIIRKMDMRRFKKFVDRKVDIV